MSQATPSQTTETPKETQPSTDTTKTEEQKPEAKAPEGPPERYEFKAPEGLKLSDELTAEASGIFKELGLTQAQADKLVEFHTKQLKSAGEAPLKAFNDMNEGWRKEVLSDAALSDGKDLKPEVKATIGRAIDSMGTKEAAAFREAMDNTGIGNHPAVIRGILALAERATEGRPVKGAGPSPAGQAKPGSGPISPAQALYPNLPSSGA